MIILICGLPGAGKTTITDQLVLKLMSVGKTVSHFNADTVRKDYDDWDFSTEGRLRQCDRMIELSRKSKSEIVICDFIAPTEEIRKRFGADYIIFMDTTKFGRYMDTNKIFEPPEKSDIRIVNFDYNIDEIVEKILCKINEKK